MSFAIKVPMTNASIKLIVNLFEIVETKKKIPNKEIENHNMK